jgi:ureidoglycolate lyase
MQLTGSSPITLVPQPLTVEAFAPFGDVITFSNGKRRNHFPKAFDRSDEAAFPSLWISYPGVADLGTVRIKDLERHPHSAQTFVPLNGGRYLVVSCGHDAQGSPDLSSLRAFIAEGNQGVTYHRNVWHHGLTALDVKTEFAVVMSLSAKKTDDEFFPLTVDVTVTLPATATNTTNAGEA